VSSRTIRAVQGEFGLRKSRGLVEIAEVGCLHLAAAAGLHPPTGRRRVAAADGAERLSRKVLKVTRRGGRVWWSVPPVEEEFGQAARAPVLGVSASPAGQFGSVHLRCRCLQLGV
jgi:hypothetical protein